MSHNNCHTLGQAPLLHVILSTGLGTGFTPLAPGTAGAVLALAAWWAGYVWLTPAALTAATLCAIVLTTAIGVWTSGVMERYWGTDPRAVNIDEFVGTWIPLLAAPAGRHTWWLALLGFAAFRLIDIYKPLGCRRMEALPGGWGVMLDDVLAGLYALAIVWGARALATA